MSGRVITVTVRGLDVQVLYREGAHYEPVWHFHQAGSHFRALRHLTEREMQAIDAACLADLVERRDAWRRALVQSRQKTEVE
jgi:hypothetical protein